MVYGAEHGGQHLARWISASSRVIKIVGFIDDSPDLMNRKVNSFPVLGMLRDLDTLCDVYAFNEVWVSVRLDESKKQQLDKICHDRGLSVYYLTDMEPFRHVL